MSIDTAALDHVCNVVRRQIQLEMPDMALVFIVHRTGGRASALNARQDEILDHPAGGEMMRFLQGLTRDDASAFAAIGLGHRRKFGLLKKRVMLAAFFVNTDEFETPEDARGVVYHLAWHAIKLVMCERNGDTDFYEIKNNIMRAKHDSLSLARENMLADVFAAIIQRLTGTKNALRALAEKRSLLALQAVPGYKPEQYPYPIAADAVELVFKELIDPMMKMRPIHQATHITEEIDYTYDDNSIKHWWAFCTAAQEMAWLGFDKSKILGTSIYTSEDPYVRSTAYLVAEALNMEPSPLTDLGSYNPFTDQEVNERLHVKACEESFKTAVAKMGSEYNEAPFLEQAEKQNARLMQGYPVGWCAHALLRASKALKNTDPEEGMQAVVTAANIFQQAREELSWNSLRMVSRMVMTKRRQGQEITPALIEEFCERTASLMVVADTFRKLSPRQ